MARSSGRLSLKRFRVRLLRSEANGFLRFQDQIGVGWGWGAVSRSIVLGGLGEKEERMVEVVEVEERSVERLRLSDMIGIYARGSELLDVG